MPGGIDVHTHLDLPFGGTYSNDDFDVGHKAAAFGGTTTHIDFVIQPKGGSLHDGLETWRRKAAPAQIDYGFHLAITDLRDDVLDEIPSLAQEGVTVDPPIKEAVWSSCSWHTRTSFRSMMPHCSRR